MGFLPREIENNDYAKFLGGKQSVLLAMWNGTKTKAKKGYEVAVIALVFLSDSSSVPFVHFTGLVKPADDVHMVSGCTVAPMAYFFIVVFQIVLKSSQ